VSDWLFKKKYITMHGKMNVKCVILVRNVVLLIYGTDKVENSFLLKQMTYGNNWAMNV
jgi:hypothetical protein